MKYLYSKNSLLRKITYNFIFYETDISIKLEVISKPRSLPSFHIKEIIHLDSGDIITRLRAQPSLAVKLSTVLPLNILPNLKLIGIKRIEIHTVDYLNVNTSSEVLNSMVISVESTNNLKLKLKSVANASKIIKINSSLKPINLDVDINNLSSISGKSNIKLTSTLSKMFILAGIFRALVITEFSKLDVLSNITVISEFNEITTNVFGGNLQIFTSFDELISLSRSAKLLSKLNVDIIINYINTFHVKITEPHKLDVVSKLFMLVPAKLADYDYVLLSNLDNKKLKNLYYKEI